MPRVEWTGRNMRYMMCAFPLVGLAIALACALYLQLLPLLAGFLQKSVSPALAALGLLLLPLALTGGIHVARPILGVKRLLSQMTALWIPAMLWEATPTGKKSLPL